MGRGMKLPPRVPLQELPHPPPAPTPPLPPCGKIPLGKGFDPSGGVSHQAQGTEGTAWTGRGGGEHWPPALSLYMDTARDRKGSP